MKKKRLLSIGFCVIIMTLIYLFAIQVISDTFANRTDLAYAANNVAYIYSNYSIAKSYKDLLDSKKYPTTMVPMQYVSRTDFSNYDLIIVGPETGSGYEWGDSASVGAIKKSARPILGLGHGGASLFQVLDLSINWGNGWIGTKNSIYVVNPEHTIYNTPNAITVPRDRIIRLYTSSGHIGEYAPYLSSKVVLHGRETDDKDHYPLVQEGKYLLWGFNASPANMYQVGKDLFINAVDLLIVKLPSLYLSLHIEDALEGVPVNKIVGDTSGPTFYTRIEIVAKLISYTSSAKDDIPVVLTIPGDLFGTPINTWVRNSNGGSLTSVGYDNLGGGQYRVTTDLSPVTLWPSGITLFYRKQIVWRFIIPNDIVPQNVTVTAQIKRACLDPYGSGTIKILSPGSVTSLIIANRKLLYDKYSDSQVSSLLQRLFTEAQGPPASHTPCGVIYYVERYDSRAYNWDYTTVNYTTEATANEVANAIDDLIEDWYEDATQYIKFFTPFKTFYIPIAHPNYLLIVGNDDTIPFYRYNDPYNKEDDWDINSNANPSIHATDEDYFFTDNPYADINGGTDWQTGDIELWTGRLLGDTAGDMLSLLKEGVDWNNGQRGGVVMASVDGWELGLEADNGSAGEVADLADVTALFRNKGFVVRNDDIPTTEVRTIDVLSPYEGGNTSWNNNFRNAANNAGGMDLFFIGGHDSYDHAVIPGDDFSPDDTPGSYTRFDNDHPIVMIVGCHGGLPVPDVGVNGGVDHCMVYDLIHEGAKAYIGASGFSYGSPGNLHKCTWGERLIQGFFINLLAPSGSNSMTIGKAMTEAKQDYTFGFGNNGAVDSLDRKTVTEFNIFGVPWTFIYYPNTKAAEEPGMEGLEEKAFTSEIEPVFIAAEEGTYTRTVKIYIDSYKVSTESQDGIAYSIFSVKGGDLAIAPDVPILPFLEGYSMPLPFSAQVTGVKVLESSSRYIGRYNIPIAEVAPWSEGGLRYTTKTNINYPYPEGNDIVTYQVKGNEVVFTVFPIQHNPTTNDTTFYSQFTVQVTYEAPITVSISEFSTNKQKYIPGERVITMTNINNVGDFDAYVRAIVDIKDALGEIMGSSQSKSFIVPSGGSYDGLSLSWSGMLADGAYIAQITLFAGDTMLGGASQEITVLGGEITDLTVPATLYVGKEGIFKLTFANYKTTSVSGEASLTIQDSEGGFVEELPPKSITVASGSTKTVSFSWVPVGVSGGSYIAIADVIVNEQAYGPKSEPFKIILNICEADFDTDGDVDGSDLAVFAADFGRTNCKSGPPCEADFDNDGDVDGSDLAVFASDFGRTNCP